MTWRSIFTVPKIQPTTARTLLEYSFLCACGALWNAFDLYHILHWSYLHGMTDLVDSQILCKSLGIDYRGAPDVVIVPVFVIVVRILARFIFWGGSSIILAAYSSKMYRYADGYRLVAFLWFATLGLDIATTFAATGRGSLLLSTLFGSTRETLTILVLLLALTILLFPRHAAKR